MSRYRFRLETVLRVRRAEEADAKATLLQANARLRSALEVRELAQQRYRDVVDHQDDRVSPEQLRRDRWEASVAAEAVAAAQREAIRGAGEAALAQVDWAQAARRVAVLERLDLRRRSEHAAEEHRREAGAVDDLVTARFAAELGVDGLGHDGEAAVARGVAPPSGGRPALRLVRSGEEG